MLPFGVTIPATVPQGSEIPEGLMDNPVFCDVHMLLVTLPVQLNTICSIFYVNLLKTAAELYL